MATATKRRPNRDLKAELARKGINQTELARRIHKSRQYLNGLINGQQEMPPDVAKLIYYTTHIPLAVILGDGKAV